MAFTNLIPQPNDQISVSQGQLLGNTVALSAVGGNTTQGSAALNLTAGYNFINFAPQGVSPTVPANRIYLYNRVEPVTALNQLYVKDTATATDIPFTAGDNLGTTNGWSYWPSGYLIKWGANSGSGNVVVNLNAVGPAYTTNPLMIQLTPQGSASVVYVVSSLSNTFTYNSSVNTSVYWFVIGF